MSSQREGDRGDSCWAQFVAPHPNPPGKAGPKSRFRILPPPIGRDPAILRILDVVEKVADTMATILIVGECGTGKEVLARFIHGMSSRCSRSFVAVNCGAIPETLQESTLFGHVRGAYTGADSQQMGIFEAADGGTVFLDEISETSKSFQVKLLRVLQSGEYFPVGSARAKSCDVRVVSATNHDLAKLIAQGHFRQDLYYRLNIIRMELPPLRERRQDIPLLTRHFLEVLGAQYDKPGMRISADARAALDTYDYPGNVRELKNIIHRAVILCQDDVIMPQDLPSDIVQGEASRKLNCTSASFHQAKAQTVEEFERDYLTKRLQESGGIVSRAARNCGLSERIFHEKMKKYAISGRRFRA